MVSEGILVEQELGKVKVQVQVKGLDKD